MPDVLLGGICSWIGVAIGFGLQIGWQEYQERIHKKKVLAAFISCVEDFIACVEKFKREPAQERHWYNALWDASQLDLVFYYTADYQTFSKAVSSVNHGKAVSLPRGRTLVFTNYDDCANIARQVLQSLEEKSQAKH